MIHPIKTCIQISELLFRWPQNQNDLLTIPDLSISQGETIFIHGASGSGKSTLLNLLTGILPPTSGNISILGENLNQLKKSQHDRFRADHFGIIFQQFNLIPYLSVMENITLPLSFSKRRLARSEISRYSIYNQALQILNSLDLNGVSIAKRNVTELSTGQQQRVATARALIGSPEIIIADEPTSALDADTKHSFLDLLFTQINKTSSTLIFVSHDQSLANIFDRTLSIHELSPNTTL